MRLKHRFEYLGVRAFRALCLLLPRGLTLWLAEALGALWFRLDSRRRRRSEENLKLLFPDPDQADRRTAVGRGAFQTLARSICDALILDTWDDDKVQSLVTVEGWEHIENAYGKGQGVLLFSGHIGCWELVPHIQCEKGLPLSMVVRPLNNPLIDTFLNRLRRSCGNKTLPKQNAVRNILRELKAGKGVAIVIDQNLRSQERIFIPFFGRLAATTPTLALMAQRTGAAMIPVFCLPQENGGYKIRYLPPVSHVPTGDRTQDTYEITRKCTRVIEDVIREHPESWLWMHRRWRTRPGPEDRAWPGKSPEVAVPAS